ncbi:MAG: hypothetical protein KH586_00020 [Tannerella sp.]|nr:hypothetical protein [Tannerella sp.]
MENLWIYVLLIFIFIVRAIAKSAQKQIDANKKKIDQDEAYISEEEIKHPVNRPLTWEDLFPSEPSQQIPVQPVVKAEKEKKKIKVTNIESSSQPEVSKKISENIKKKSAISDDAYNIPNNSELLPYGSDELRKAIIASEILARKF